MRAIYGLMYQQCIFEVNEKRGSKKCIVTARMFQHGMAMQSVPVASFLGRTDDSIGSHLVLEGATRLYLRVLVPYLPPVGVSSARRESSFPPGTGQGRDRPQRN